MEKKNKKLTINIKNNTLKRPKSRPLTSKNINKINQNKSYKNIEPALEESKTKNKFSKNESKGNILYKNKSNESLKDEIQKLLILIFYYEKTVNSNKNKIFSCKDTFYLVNPNWINDFKKHYNYQGFFDILNNYYKQNNDINYFDVDNVINDIKSKIKDININKLNLSEDLLNKEKIRPPLEQKFKVKYYKISFIIPSKIMNLIKKLFTNNEQPFQSTEVFFKNDNIYIIESNNIYIGNLNNQLSFSPKYIFSYNSIDLIGEEKSKKNLDFIEDYIKMNKCKHLSSDKEQYLKNQNDETIGKLIILNNDSGSVKDRAKKFEKRNVQKNDMNEEFFRTIKNTPKKNKIIKKPFMKEEKPNDKSYIITKEKEKNLESNNMQNNNQKLIDEINKLKEDNNKKDDEIKKLKEEIQKQKNDEIIFENNKLKKELNETKIQLKQLRKENEKLKNFINEKEKKLNEVNELNIIKQKDKLNQNENKNKDYKNIIDVKENQKMMQDNNELINTMDYLKVHCLNKKKSIINNNRNINFNFTEYNEECSNLDIGFNLNNSLNKTYQIPNTEDNEKFSKFAHGGNSEISQYKSYKTPNTSEIINKNDKKIHYLNIVLEFLSLKLGDYFLNSKTIDIIRENNNNQYQLSNEFLKYIQNLDKNSKEMNSSSILKIIENIDKNLEYNYNLKNIISTILEQLHKELKKENVIKEILPGKNKEETDLQAFLREFQKETSKITDLFTGFIEKVIQCNVNLIIDINKIYELEKYNYLIIGKKCIKNKVTNLSECLFNYNQVKTFTEEVGKESKCKICKGMCPKTFYSYYYSNPNNLILILDIENENSNEDIKVKFEEKLTLNNKKSEDNYNLSAVITQIGIDRQNIVLSYKKDNNWYRYNNEGKKLINNIQKEVIDFEHPLVLLYEKN